MNHQQTNLLYYVTKCSRVLCNVTIDNCPPPTSKSIKYLVFSLEHDLPIIRGFSFSVIYLLLPKIRIFKTLFLESH